jgi:peptidoglycan/xylan/chitin deacetylase (PgdA/CDA1 family)
VLRGRIDTARGKSEWVAGAPKAALLAATPDEQAIMLAALAESTSCTVPSDLAARLYLAPEDWASLVGLGMRVGAHSVRHPRLTQVEPTSLRAEVAASVHAIAALGLPVSFAYPDGAFDDRVVSEVQRAGVSSAVTCEPGIVQRTADAMRLPRDFVTSPGA